VTVKDKDGMPLRALKTNRLGQFAASTQLPNGIYFVETEDPRLRYTFDRAQITLNGSIVPALEIFAKSEKEITRAKLEKELFGTPTQ
jgi:HEAT repeat protein